MIIGIDFDNTIISYDALIHTIAVEQKLIKTDHVKHKKAIRDTIRKQPNGDIKWQEIQALIQSPEVAKGSRKRIPRRMHKERHKNSNYKP